MRVLRFFSNWMQRHVSDGYVKKSKKEGYRSRSAYKLIEMNDQHSFLKPNTKVLDLGCSPGGWSQVSVKLTKSLQSAPKVIAVDILPMVPIQGCLFLQLDIHLQSTIDSITTHAGSDLDLILSDMSSNHSGITEIDCSSTIDLNLQTIALAKKLLRTDGKLLMKMFHGPDESAFFVTHK